MLQLKLSLAGKDDSKEGDLEATTAAAIAGVRQALAMQSGGSTEEAQAAATAETAERRQRMLLKQQEARQKVLSEGPVFLRRYQGYVQAVADRLTQQQQQPPSGSSVSPEQQQAFPTFPFTLIETLSLWQLSRLAIMTRTDMTKDPAANSNSEPWDDFT